MSTTVVVLPATAPDMLGWLQAHGQLLQGSPPNCGYPTLAQIRSAVRSLDPSQTNERFDPAGARPAHWYCDVLFGPVEAQPGRGVSYGGGGFEISADVDEAADDIPVHELTFRGGTPDWVFAVCRELIGECGPLVAVDASWGVPAVVTEDVDPEAFTNTLHGGGRVPLG